MRDLRRQGLKPAIVFVMAFDEMKSHDMYHPDMQLENDSEAEVHIEPDDNILALDFRFLTGCVVAINTDSRERARKLYKQIRRVGPASITVSDSTFTHHETF